MTLPNWKAIPVRTKRSRRRLHNLIADEFNLDSWNELPNPIKRSKRKLFNYYAEELHLEEFKELLKQDVRSTREYYIYLKENANPSSAPTLTITVKSGESNVSGASVTIGSTTKSTGSDGKTTFTLDYDDYLVEVSKSGYADLEENIKFRANHKSFTLNIEATGGDTGTVTVTCQRYDEEELIPVSSCSVLICTELPPSQQTVVASTESGEDGVATFDEPITYGNYILFAIDSTDTYTYTNDLTVDGDEEVTITLTSGGDTGTVTVTCKDESENLLDGAEVFLGPQSNPSIYAYGKTDSNGVTTLTLWDSETHQPTQDTSIAFDTYVLTAQYKDAQEDSYVYQNNLTVDGDENVIATLTLDE